MPIWTPVSPVGAARTRARTVTSIVDDGASGVITASAARLRARGAGASPGSACAPSTAPPSSLSPASSDARASSLGAAGSCRSVSTGAGSTGVASSGGGVASSAGGVASSTGGVTPSAGATESDVLGEGDGTDAASAADTPPSDRPTISVATTPTRPAPRRRLSWRSRRRRLLRVVIPAVTGRPPTIPGRRLPADGAPAPSHR